MAHYRDPVLLRIKEMLEQHGPAKLKGNYGLGDPGVVSKSQVQTPIAFISYETQNFKDITSGEFQSAAPVIVNVVYDMTRDFGQGTDSQSHMSVTELACGRNPDYSLKKDSIVGAIRNHPDLYDTDKLQLNIDVETETDVEFDALNRDKGLVTSEAIIRFTVLVRQLRDEFMQQ